MIFTIKHEFMYFDLKPEAINCVGVPKKGMKMTSFYDDLGKSLNIMLDIIFSDGALRGALSDVTVVLGMRQSIGAH